VRAGLLKRARQRRAELTAGGDDEPTSAFRLFHRDADGEPRLAIDVYGPFAVLHLFDAYPPASQQAVLAQLSELGVEGVYLKRHPRQKNELVDARGSELAPSEPIWGRAAPEPLIVHEHGLPFSVRLGDGLRTGLFLDQRDNRKRVRQLAPGRRVLNLFAYTGGFSVAALAGGASEALCVDSSSSALSRARDNTALLGPALAARHRVRCDDAFDALRRLGKRGERFDLVVVDPPSYSKTRSRRFRARKDYVELCRGALRVLSPGGYLLTCINHHGSDFRELQGFVERALAQEGKVAQASTRMPSGCDFPAVTEEGAELKSLLTRVG